MYLKAFEERTIPDEETISLNYLPDRILSSTIATAMDEQSNHNQAIGLNFRIPGHSRPLFKSCYRSPAVDLIYIIFLYKHHKIYRLHRTRWC